jgi:hypothetical protein
MNRDSVLWWVGIVGAILTALANQAGLFPPAWYGYINLSAVLVGVISGYLKASPLPGAPKW